MDCDRRGFSMLPVPQLRLEVRNERPVNLKGQFILYWMIASRRSSWNFALDEAIEWAKNLKKPILVLEALRCDYQWASDRLHFFLLTGMAENARRFQSSKVHYYPYVEMRKGEGKGLLSALAAHSCLVITDHFPCFFLPRMVAAAASKIPVRLIQVDSNGLLPLRAAGQPFSSAYAFRRFLQKNLPPHLSSFPQAQPLAGLDLPSIDSLPAEIEKRWPPASPQALANPSPILSQFPIDQSISPGIFSGGEAQAEKVWREFLHRKLDEYEKKRNQPQEEGTSGLSPYLHFGHISVHRLFSDLSQKEKWSAERIASKSKGSRMGWWGMSPAAEAFLDQLVTWRELGYNMCAWDENYDRYESLPAWARSTLEKHSKDLRPYLYGPFQLEKAQTHDPLWNAAQIQLIREGRIHNYLRMLWGKKILEWSPSPQEALATMIELNNKYALDGRDPNSYSGIFWVLGRYDRPWGPERPIFGKIRYMSSENTARKVRIENYKKKYSPPPTL